MEDDRGAARMVPRRGEEHGAAGEEHSGLDAGA
jgi:hypothetical protein